MLDFRPGAEQALPSLGSEPHKFGGELRVLGYLLTHGYDLIDSHPVLPEAARVINEMEVHF